MFNKILLAYDGSQTSKLALSKTVELAKKFESKVILLAVAGIPEYSESKG
jgi:nucleotide-binding universal stress UspA family protein